MTDERSCRQEALRQLARRDYSRAELAHKLTLKFSGPAEQAEHVSQVIATVLDQLQQGQLLSDQRYATQRVRNRAPRFGNARLRQELQEKGVGSEEISAALASSEDEVSRCYEVLQRKYGKAEPLATLAFPEQSKERARRLRFLQARGFSLGVIQKALKMTDTDYTDVE